MSERNLRPTLPVTIRRSRQPYPSPSYHRRSPPARQSPKRSTAVKILQKIDSEPNLWTVGQVGAGDEHRNLTSPDVLFCRRETCTDIFSSPKRSTAVKILQKFDSEPNLWNVSLVGAGDEHRNMTAPDAVFCSRETYTDIFSSPDLLSQSPQSTEGYNKDAKVVVNVTVEGSTGPIRIMVKLGSNVEDTIKVVIKKYSEEGRSPQLGKDAASTFELHHSYFSLQSLKKSDVIGDVGSRSFYLRKNNNGDHGMGRAIASSASFIAGTSPSPAFFFLPAFIARKINKIIRRSVKLWKILGCMH